MNKKIVLAIMLGAFTLAACTPVEVDVSLLWRKNTSNGTETVSKETRTIYLDEKGNETVGKTDKWTTIVTYIHKIEYPGGASASSSVDPCGGGFCDENGRDVTKVASSETLDKKNKRVSRIPRGHQNFASGTPSEQEVDYGSGSSY